MSNVCVIGGGAAGMMAAITAGECGNKVTLFEKNEKLGKKLFITGKGRCNVCNASDEENIFNNVLKKKNSFTVPFTALMRMLLWTFSKNTGLNLKLNAETEFSPLPTNHRMLFRLFLKP